MGVTVTRKVGSAVVRNRLKRRVREFFRHNAHNWPQGLDLVFIARHSAGERSKLDMASDLEKIGQKLMNSRIKQSGDRPGTNGPSRMAGQSPGKPGEISVQGAASGLTAESRNEPAAKDTTPASFDSAYYGPPLNNGDWLSELSLALGRLPSRLALGFIFFYQKCISPMLPPCCRFRPTCSCYAAEAVKTHGFWRGSYLAGRRILKCHPFHPGGYDPVPPKSGPPVF